MFCAYQEPPSRDRIIWLDLEMCSLTDHRVLECAVILTTCNALTEVARKNWVIATSKHDILTRVLAGDGAPFHEKNSLSNGLIQACLDSSTTYEEWQRELLAFLQSHCQPGCRLAGFSVHADLNVLRTQAPEVHQFLSHRIIDISSLDIIQWGLPQLESAARSWPVIAKLKRYQSWLREHMTTGDITHHTSKNRRKRSKKS